MTKPYCHTDIEFDNRSMCGQGREQCEGCKYEEYYAPPPPPRIELRVHGKVVFKR